MAAELASRDKKIMEMKSSENELQAIQAQATQQLNDVQARYQ